MNKIDVGIAGCGNIAVNKHIKNLLKLPEVKITALFDTDVEKAKQINESLLNGNAIIYTDYETMVQDRTLDVIHVCTPNKFHAPMSIKALKAGKHVMCEKPMAMNAKEAKRMVIAAQKSGKKLGISLQNRFRKDSLHLKNMVTSGELGHIYYAKAHAVRRRAVPVWGDFLNKNKQGGGALIDIGIHALDLTMWLMDNFEPKYVIGKAFTVIGAQPCDFNSLGDWDIKKFQVDESAFAQIVMKDNSVINLEASWALNTLDIGEAKTTLCGSLAGADMKDGLRINGVHHHQLYTQKPQLEKQDLEYYDDTLDDPGYVEMKTWINAIMKNQPYIVKPEEVYTVTKIIDAIYDSSIQDKPIYLENY